MQRTIPTLHPKVEEALFGMATQFAQRGIELFVFGSLAQGSPHKGADLDIGYFGNSEFSKQLIYELETAINSLPTIRPIDLVDFSKTSERFKEEALKHTISLT